jgi:hypothetical protein
MPQWSQSQLSFSQFSSLSWFGEHGGLSLPGDSHCIFVMWLCGVFAGVCALHSTWPSSAPRRQASGIITWIVDHKEGRSHAYTLGLARPNEIDLQLQASATPPFFAKGRDLVSVTYLDEKVTGRYPRAIGFHVLTGPRAGYNDDVSADWFGPWLGVLIGPPCGLAALWIAFGNKRVKAEKQGNNESRV